MAIFVRRKQVRREKTQSELTQNNIDSYHGAGPFT